MASGILMNMKEEVTCPICLELLTEPLSLDCGHSFCQACLAEKNKEPMISEEGESSCPECQIRYQPGNLRPNWHLANIVEMLREVKLSPEEEQKTDLCERHGEKLLLFCKEDGKFICWLCERSQEHRGHHTFLMEEVAQKYQNKLQAALDRLREMQQEAEKLEADIREERIFWESQIQNESHSVQEGFKKLRGILDNKERKELQTVEKEKRIILHNLEESESEQVKQSQLLRDLISDLEHRLQGSVMKMLQDVNDIMRRSHTFILKKPKTVSRKQRRVFQVPDLNGMLQVFDELTTVRCYWVHIILDRPNNRQNLAISEDRRRVRYKCPDYSDVRPKCPDYSDVRSKYRFKSDRRYQDNDCDVLGSPFFTSGKHYWEVDVSQKNAWILGVCCQKSPNFSLFYDLNEVSNGRNAVCLTPKNTSHNHGYWVIGSRERFECKAFAESSSSDPLKLTLYLNVPPDRVGIFLDYDDRAVSFYNVTNHGFLIYKFSSCSFSQKVDPYFNPMDCTHPMILCSPSS